MKISNRKKNARRTAVGKDPFVPPPELKPFDGEKFHLDMMVAIKEHPTGFPHVDEEMSVWNPPMASCSCGFSGRITECGRTYFPPDNVGWDCPDCQKRVEVDLSSMIP